jgi:hypothetical protein
MTCDIVSLELAGYVPASYFYLCKSQYESRRSNPKTRFRIKADRYVKIYGLVLRKPIVVTK